MYLGFTIPIYCYNRARSINTLLECLEKNSYLHHDIVLVLDHPKTPPRPGELLPGNPYPTVWDLLDKKWRTKNTENIDIRVSFKQHNKVPEHSQWLSAAETVNYAATIALSRCIMSLSNPDFYLAPNWDYNLVKYGLGNNNLALCPDLYYDYGYRDTEVTIPDLFPDQRYFIRPVHHYTFPYKRSGGVKTFDVSHRGYPEFSFSEPDFLNYAAKTSMSPNRASVVEQGSPPFYIMVFDREFFIRGGGIPLVDGHSADRWDDLPRTMPTFCKLVIHDSTALTYHCDLELCEDVMAGPGTSWFIPLKPEYAQIVIRTKGDRADFFTADTTTRFARTTGPEITIEDETVFSTLRQATLSQYATMVCALGGLPSCNLLLRHLDKETETFRLSVDHHLGIHPQSLRTLLARSRFQISEDPKIVYTPSIPIRDMVYIET